MTRKYNQKISRFWRRRRRLLIIVSLTAAVHLSLLLLIKIQADRAEEREDNSVFKLVDVQEVKPPPEKKVVIVQTQEKGPVEKVVEVEEEVFEVSGEPDYLPQHKISKRPQIPVDQFYARLKYPELANSQRIEGTVFLELYIDDKGLIRRVKVLKSPGFGFGEAAVKAMTGLVCPVSAESNGVKVAVIFRVPVSFKLK